MRKPFGMVRSAAQLLLAGSLVSASFGQNTSESRPVADPAGHDLGPQGEGQPQGKPVNRLSKESSPYLRQHQHNPVDWYPWGPEALALAAKLDRPIFLSIGYSACHWCHVMAAESFSDPAIAKLMNDNYVCIKVDREERPDIDEIYMGAVHAMGQQGGWPLSAWLTPEGKPFYGGTYFPPEDGLGRPGFRRVCLSLASAWKEKREDVLQNASALSDHLQKVLAPTLSPSEPTSELLAGVLAQARERYDSEHGGFAHPPRRAPKFPHATELLMLMRLESEEAHQMAVESLDAMRRGGIHDQLGGGFHRYSTDRQWLVPHFEKMLYDNALLVPAYLEAYRLTDAEHFADVARTTLDYLLREMQAPTGGFWASQDAQSEGVEGKFFVWQHPEVAALLGADAGMACKVLGVTPSGNWEHQNVLWLADESAASDSFQKSKDILFAARAKRVHPGTDDKILTSWNGLTLNALSQGYRTLGDTRYLLSAQRTARFLIDNVVIKGRAMRSWQGGQARHRGYLEDYAALAGGLVSLFEVDSDPAWLLCARELLEQVARHFKAEDGGFWFTADDHEELLARTKSASEGARPSGTAIAIDAFLRAGLLLGDERLYGLGLDALRAHHKLMRDSPAAAPSMLLAVQFHLAQPKEVIVAGDPDDSRTQDLLQAAWNKMAHGTVVALVHSGNRKVLEHFSPVFRDKRPLDGVPTAYVCERGVCQAPITDPTRLSVVVERGRK